MDFGNKKLSFMTALILIISWSYLAITYAGSADQISLNKLAEVNYADYDSDCETEAFYFNNQKHFIDYKADGTNLVLSTKRFSSDFKNFETYSTTLNTNYDLGKLDYIHTEIKYSNSIAVIYIRGSSFSPSYESYQGLFKSTDGINWTPLRNEKSDLAWTHHVSDGLIIAGSASGIVFTRDQGNTWQALEAEADLDYMENFENKVLYRKRNNLGQATSYSVLDISNMEFKSTNFPTLKVTKNDTDYALDLSWATVMRAGDFLIAEAIYVDNNEKDMDSRLKEAHLVSKDNGLSWENIDLKFPQEDLRFFTKHDGFYYAATNSDSDSSSHDSGNESSTDQENSMKDELKNSKTYYYKMTEDQFLNASKKELSPVYTLDNTRLQMSSNDQKNNPDRLELVYVLDDVLKVGFFNIK